MNKTVYIITGGIASGKSTLSYSFLRHFLPDASMPFVSTDVYYSTFFDKGGDFDTQYNRARLFTDRIADRYLEEGVSFVWETVVSKEKKRIYINRLKAAGYRIVCLFVGLESAETAISRSAKRERDGCHAVAADFIRDRYRKSLDALRWLSGVSDVLAVFDNTERMKLVYYRSETERYSQDNPPGWVRDTLGGNEE